ncbi:alpha-1D adrenergic receptor [Lingula anatina]|uniref:Alpha-1D adrenergic receptor n=1 Tax=Lingula anatina TaxID=7574 RepID=A0A1S3KA35_LINAN|nr:alpha-1D adrenergic receptor [Lingula anatina]XP_013419312.1 alpha-1D adrenergic receptor [Lingula anatina]XP_013419313.1 alpha-1D adrenergic receptor [Lingula anatina]XP_013419314.1 alpha-1D adrenergic receptor [Lingula anatina]XP_013419315.1 alpha-1D adrenergic receptor [Lingula anatina]XP_013419316.1 alpha-1D adrenergic receptor [Lingula anatina]|eukprot:XP_013419311.1 alpha-1D adrenergic receptor [Lingula anatina]
MEIFTGSVGNVSDVYNETVTVDIEYATLVGLCLCLIVTMTISGNVLVLLAVALNSHLRSATNYFIMNLALADLLLGIAVLPFSASLEILNYWAFGRAICDIWAAVDVLCCTASIMTLCVISVDRYIGVSKPLQHCYIITERRAALIVVLVWLLSLVISLGPLIGWKEPADPDERVCTVTTQTGYVIFSVSGSFYIPMVIIVGVYYKIYKAAIRQSTFLSTGYKRYKGSSTDDNGDESKDVILRVHVRSKQGAETKVCDSPHKNGSMITHPNSNHHSHAWRETKDTDSRSRTSSVSSRNQPFEFGRRQHSRHTLLGKIAKFRREKKAAKTLGIVVGVFILCWFPFFFVLPLDALCPSCYIPKLLFKIIFWLGYCNSLMNPIIYAFSSRDFREAFRRILHCHFQRKRSFIRYSDVDVSSPQYKHKFRHDRRKAFRNGDQTTGKSCASAASALNGSGKFASSDRRSHNRTRLSSISSTDSHITSSEMLHMLAVEHNELNSMVSGERKTTGNESLDHAVKPKQQHQNSNGAAHNPHPTMDVVTVV